MLEPSTPVAVALLHASSGGDGHLRNALTEHGASVVYEALSAEIDRDALENSGARVVVVSLGSDSDDYIDQVYDVLETGEYEVVFNDAEVSRELSGWDQARWARNLAAKITSRPEIAEPPRPGNAPNVPVPAVDRDAAAAKETPPAEWPLEAAHGKATDDQAAADQEAEWTRLAQELSTPPSPASRPGSDRGAGDVNGHDDQTAEPVGETEPDALSLADLGTFAMDSAPEIGSQPDVRDDSARPHDDSGNATPRDSGAQVADLADDLASLFSGEDSQPGPVGEDTTVASAPEAAADDAFSLELPEEFNLAAGPDDDAPLAVSNAYDADDTDDDIASLNILTDEPEEGALDRNADVQSLKTLYSPDWDLEPLDRIAAREAEAKGDAPDDFGIDKISASEYLDPTVREAAQQVPVARSDITLELMPMEEAIKPAVQHGDQPEVRPEPAVVSAPGVPVERVCVLGASIGGPEAVRDFLGAFPRGFPALFILAQHMGEEFVELMSTQLRRAVQLTVREPTHGERAGHGEILIVPTSHRLKVNPHGVVTFENLGERPPYSPSIDQVLRDVADTFADKARAIIFSGMAHDAIEGGRYLRSRGGKVWIQDPKTCVVSSMVDGLEKAGIVDFSASPLQLAEHLISEYRHS